MSQTPPEPLNWIQLGQLKLGSREPRSNDNDIKVENQGTFESPSHLHKLASPSTDDISHQFIAPENFATVTENHSPRPTKNVSKYGNPNLLPFEFRVLEFCLESTCQHFESETTMLEKEGYCALDDLTSKIKSLNLERVRQIKSRLEKLSGHVKKVRDELEHLLDDDTNMAQMYLTVKFVDQQVEETSTKDESNEVSFEDFELVNERVEVSKSEVARSFSLKSDTKELEFLLEAYFTQIDGILSKLSNLREYVNDTEDYINIMLDDKQNLLLRMDLMLKIFTFIMAAAMAVVDTLGMLIHTKLFDAGQLQFLETVFGISFGCLVLCLIAIWLGRRRQLF